MKIVDVLKKQYYNQPKLSLKDGDVCDLCLNLPAFKVVQKQLTDNRVYALLICKDCYAKIEWKNGEQKTAGL